MKRFSIAVALLSLVVFGCGPSAEQQKMMADLTSEVTTMVNETQSSVEKLGDIGSQLSSTLASGDSLKMKFPKDSAAVNTVLQQVRSAHTRVMSVKDNVSAWIAAYTAPDVSKLSFDQVMARLKGSKEELTSATSEIQNAISSASGALQSYKDMASGMLAKVASKKR